MTKYRFELIGLGMYQHELLARVLVTVHRTQFDKFVRKATIVPLLIFKPVLDFL